jgi:hypothetical protein
MIAFLRGPVMVYFLYYPETKFPSAFTKHVTGGGKAMGNPKSSVCSYFDFNEAGQMKG